LPLHVRLHHHDGRQAAVEQHRADRRHRLAEADLVAAELRAPLGQQIHRDALVMPQRLPALEARHRPRLIVRRPDGRQIRLAPLVARPGGRQALPVGRAHPHREAREEAFQVERDLRPSGEGEGRPRRLRDAAEPPLDPDADMRRHLVHDPDRAVAPDLAIAGGFARRRRLGLGVVDRVPVHAAP
jgi:hypothetical protein